jgi:transposase-like protein
MRYVDVTDEGSHYSCKCRWCRPQYEYTWKTTPVCPYCGSTKRIKRVREGLPDLYQCSNCRPRKQFNVLTRTLFQRTKIPLVKWFKVWYYERKRMVLTHSYGKLVGRRRVPMHRYAKFVDLSYREIQRIKAKMEVRPTTYVRRGWEDVFEGSCYMYRFFLRLQFGADYVRGMCRLREPRKPQLKKP